MSSCATFDEADHQCYVSLGWARIEPPISSWVSCAPLYVELTAVHTDITELYRIRCGLMIPGRGRPSAMAGFVAATVCPWRAGGELSVLCGLADSCVLGGLSRCWGELHHSLH